jgi:hypothetical protein
MSLQKLLAEPKRLAVLALDSWAELQQTEAGYQVSQGPKVTDASKLSR